MEDSDLEGLSDISVSSVHTSDLSSFDEESEEELPLSDSTEEGEITSEGKACVAVQQQITFILVCQQVFTVCYSAIPLTTSKGWF